MPEEREPSSALFGVDFIHRFPKFSQGPGMLKPNTPVGPTYNLGRLRTLRSPSLVSTSCFALPALAWLNGMATTRGVWLSTTRASATMLNQV